MYVDKLPACSPKMEITAGQGGFFPSMNETTRSHLFTGFFLDDVSKSSDFHLPYLENLSIEDVCCLNHEPKHLEPFLRRRGATLKSLSLETFSNPDELEMNWITPCPNLQKFTQTSRGIFGGNCAICVDSWRASRLVELTLKDIYFGLVLLVPWWSKKMRREKKPNS